MSGAVQHYTPQEAVGIDVDNTLIKRARRKLQMLRTNRTADIAPPHCHLHDTMQPDCADCLIIAEVPVSSAQYIPAGGSTVATDAQPSMSKLYSTHSMMALSDALSAGVYRRPRRPIIPDDDAVQHTRFLNDDILAPVWNAPDCSGMFDLILCLSLTKWIQLNWGDDGVKALFRRIFYLLSPGGMLVLEPQPYVTYKKSSKLTPVHKYNYAHMQFMPEQYSTYLLNDVGFRREILVGTVDHATALRPLYLFVK